MSLPPPLHYGVVTDSPADPPSSDRRSADPAPPSGSRSDLGIAEASPNSGRNFVIGTGVVAALFLLFLLVVSPRLQDQLGLTEGARTFPAPDAVVEMPLTLDGQAVGTAVWDATGVCAEITDATGTSFRTCAVPDPLRPIWAIDAPDEADPGFLIVGGPPEVAKVAVVTTDGERLTAEAQVRDMPASWTLIPLPAGSAVRDLIAFNEENSDLGNAECAPTGAVGQYVDALPSDGPDRLSGGCMVPRQD
ncbi:hypothetical protein BH23ACT9_BH23ACT9_13210 [soil metagenome]